MCCEHGDRGAIESPKESERRRFLKLGVLGAGVALVKGISGALPASASSAPSDGHGAPKPAEAHAAPAPAAHGAPKPAEAHAAPAPAAHGAPKPAEAHAAPAPAAHEAPKPKKHAVRAAHGTDALLLSCMDFRLVDEMALYMHHRGLTDRYDHVVLAGASLGVLTNQFPGWGDTFWQHLDISIKFHGIKQLIVMDHRDCSAYKTFLGKDFGKNPRLEHSVHANHLKTLGGAVRQRFPRLNVELLMMGLDGGVEKMI